MEIINHKIKVLFLLYQAAALAKDRFINDVFEGIVET